MRTIRFVLAIVFGLSLMLIIAANMTPVDLHLLPRVLGIEGLSLNGVPLALVIVLALLAGVLLGTLIEFAREAKHRQLLEEKRREIGRLREENAKLMSQLGAEAEDLALLPA